MTLTALALLAATNSASAGATLETTLTLPNSSVVYEDDSYSVTVKNTGNRHANGVSVTIQLPETNTSPQVFPMGVTSNLDSSCSESGTEITCSMGRIRKGKSETVSFDMFLPQSAGSIDFSATASASNASDDTDTDSATVTYIDIPLAGPYAVDNSHCTGQGLEAYFECTLFPSSLSGHSVTYNADGTITFTEPGYSGYWGQGSDDHLWFEYYNGTTLVAEFDGNGVDDGATEQCFEGLTTFPNSVWVAPYETCLQ